MKSNPFNENLVPDELSMPKSEHTLSLFSPQTDFNLPNTTIDKKNLKEKTIFLVEIFVKNTNELIISLIKKIFYPIFSKSQETSTLIQAQATSIKGSKNSEVYQLLNMLSNKKHYISVKASVRLETIISDDNNRKIVSNYFRLNPKAQSKYSKLYNLVTQTEANKL